MKIGANRAMNPWTTAAFIAAVLAGAYLALPLKVWTLTVGIVLVLAVVKAVRR